MYFPDWVWKDWMKFGSRDFEFHFPPKAAAIPHVRTFKTLKNFYYSHFYQILDIQAKHLITKKTFLHEW